MKAQDTRTYVGERSLASDAGGCSRRPVPILSREEWLRTYTERVLHAWRGRHAPLGLAPAYARWIRRDLSQCYQEPLMRAFIEQTYSR